MKNFKFTFSVGILLIISLGIFSCKKEIPVPSNSQTEESSEKDISLKHVSTSGSNTIYEVSPLVVNNFQHYCQLNAPSPINGSAACGPTSYMMAASCIARYLDPNTAYTTSGTKLQTIVNITGVSTNLATLSNYATNYDGSFLSVTTSYGSNRETIKNFIKNSLAANKFVITGINAYVMSPSPVNNSNFYLNASTNGDLNAGSDITSGTYRNYISSSDEGGKVGGHIIVILKFVQTASDGSGYIEYIDPIATTRPFGVSNRRYVSFTRLLDAIKMNGNNTFYDAFAIGI